MNQVEQPLIFRNSKLMILVKSIGTLIALQVFSGNRINDFHISTLVYIISIILIIVIVVLFWFFDWKTRSLTIQDNNLLFCHGILNKRKLTISYANVSSVDLTRPLFYRFFFLTKLKVDSNSVGVSAGIKNDISLGLSKKSAEHIRIQILNKIHGEEKEVTDQSIGEILYKANTGKLFCKSILSMLSVVLICILFATIPIIVMSLTGFDRLLGLGTCFAALVVIIGLSAINIILGYGGMSLSKDQDRIRISYGVLDKKSVSMPINKINGIIVTQNILQRIFGFYNMRVLSSGYGDEKGELMSYIALSLKKQEAEFIKNEIIGMEDTEYIHIKPSKKMSVLYYLPLLIISIIEILFSFFIGIQNESITLTTAIIIFIFTLLACTLNFIHSQMSFQNKYFIINKGGVYAQTVYIKRERCQTITYRQGLIQRVFSGGRLIMHLFAFRGRNIISIWNIDKKVLSKFNY